MGFIPRAILRRRVPALRLFVGPPARLSAWIALAVLAVALIAGAVRVLPLLLAPGVPLALAPVLARGVAAVALEAALFVGPPIGWALAASRLVERGEARALFAAGLSPIGVAARSWPALIGVMAVAAMAAGLWGREARAPGRAIRDMLTEARAACVRAEPPAVADVPLLGVSWICLKDGAPRAVGLMPGRLGPAVAAAPGGAFMAAAITVSDDLTSLDARDLELALPAAAAGAEARVHVARASIRGLSPIGRASNLHVAARVATLALTSALLGLVAATLALTGAAEGRVVAVGVGASGPAASLLVFSSLERSPAPAVAYVAVPLAGLAAILALARLARLVRTRRARSRATVARSARG